MQNASARPLKAESPGSSPGNATIILNQLLIKIIEYQYFRHFSWGLSTLSIRLRWRVPLPASSKGRSVLPHLNDPEAIVCRRLPARASSLPN